MCCMQKTKWELPADVHQFVDKVQKLEAEVAEFKEHLRGLIRICETIINSILEYEDDDKLERHEWIVEGWDVEKSNRHESQTVSHIKRVALKCDTMPTEQELEEFCYRLQKKLGGVNVENLSKNEIKEYGSKYDNCLLVDIEGVKVPLANAMYKIENGVYIEDYGDVTCGNVEEFSHEIHDFDNYDKQKDCEIAFRDIKKSLESLTFYVRDSERRLQRMFDTIKIKLDLEDLMDNHTFTIMGIAFVIPTVVSGFMGMNCAVPMMPDRDGTENLSTFWGIVIVTVSLCFLTSLYSLFFAGTHSRFSIIVPDLNYLCASDVDLKKFEGTQREQKLQDEKLGKASSIRSRNRNHTHQPKTTELATTPPGLGMVRYRTT